jgi:hypothetical protein
MTLKINLTAVLVSVAVAACAQSGTPPSTSTQPQAADTSVASQAATESQDAAAMAADPRLVVVHKNESCGCCKLWVEHLKQNGFHVNVHDVSNLGPIKERVGIPYGQGSCHTAQIGGYFVEGHVPASDIQRLLTERPDAKGLTVPGMPAGSPGMETPSGEVQPYDVLLVGRDGSTTVFAHHGS